VKESRKKKLTSYQGSSEDWDDVYWPDETGDIVNQFVYVNHGRYLRSSTNNNNETTFFYYDFDEEIYGDLNGNGVVDQVRNQLIRTSLPAVDLDHDGTKETTPFMTYEYSNFGVVAEIGADGTLVTTQYYNTGLPKNHGKIYKKIVDPNGLNLQTTFEYDNYGFVNAVIDPKGNRTEMENDLFGRVVKQYQPYVYSNMARIFTENIYDDAGNLTQTKTTLLNHLGVAIGNGFITSNTQYQNSRVTTSSVSVNDSTQLTSSIVAYDGYNRVIESLNPKGNRSKSQFALDGRLTLSKIGVGTDVEIHSKPDYNFINQPLGNYTPYYLGHSLSQRKFLSFNIYDEFGRLKIVQDEFESSFQEYPTPGEVENFKLYSQTGTGNRAINVYEGELLKKVEKWDVDDRLLQSSENFYDTHNRVIKTTVTTYTYVNGIQEIESALSSESFYDIAGRVVKTINPYGAISIGKFDTIGRNIGSLTYKNQAAFNNNQAEVETTLVLDNAGLVEFSTIKEYNHVTQLYEERTQSFEYDSLNRVTKTIDPNGHITQSFYNSVNQVEKVIDAEGNVTRNEHDHLGNVVKAIQEYRDANGDYVKESTITNVYENGNELKQYIDDANNITEYSYDIHSRLETTKLPGNDNLIYSQLYNAMAQVTQATMPDGTVVNNVYNDNTQLESVTITKGTNVSANYGADYYFYEYNPLKQLQQVTCKKGGALGTQISQLGYQYDSSGRVTHESQKHGSLPAKTIQSKFFDTANKNQLVHPSGTIVEYRRNELGQLHQIAKNNVVVKENTFVGGKQARIQRGPLTQSLVYGNGNELLTSKYQNGNQTIVDYTLGYNKVYYKNFEKRNHESGIGDRYKYDSVYHLIETAYDAPLPEINANGYVKKEAVEYSNTDFRNSIIKFDTLGIIDQKFYQPNALHQAIEIDAVQGANGANRSYNRNGNLTQNETGDLYEFDYANKLVKVRTKDANNLPIDVVFTYDCTGRKIQKTVTQTNTNTIVVDEHYYYSGEEVIAEYNASDVLLRSYVLGERIDIPVVVTEGLYDYYFVYDTHGSVIAIANANGIVEEKYKYDAHGNFEVLIDSQWVNNRYFYAARDWEAEIKLYHNRARFYDPQNGFFIQRDPLGYVDGSNPYVYTSGNSINYFDPLGLNEKGYWSNVGDYWVGYYRGGKSMVTGVYTLVRHPIKSGQGIYTAASNPKQTWEIIKSDYAKKLQSSSGQGEIIFEAVTTIVTLGGGTATNAAGKTGTIVNTIEKTASLTKIGEKAADVGKFADNIINATNSIEKASELSNLAKVADGATDLAKTTNKIDDVVTSANKIQDVVTPAKDLTPQELVQKIANKSEAAGIKKGFGPAGTGNVQGIYKHKYAERLLKRYQELFGEHMNLLPEQSWLNKNMVPYRMADSATPDVFDLTTGFIYDYKFVKNPGQGLSTKQMNNNLKNVDNVTNQIEINPIK